MICYDHHDHEWYQLRFVSLLAWRLLSVYVPSRDILVHLLISWLVGQSRLVGLCWYVNHCVEKEPSMKDYIDEKFQRFYWNWKTWDVVLILVMNQHPKRFLWFLHFACFFLWSKYTSLHTQKGFGVGWEVVALSCMED